MLSEKLCTHFVASSQSVGFANCAGKSILSASALRPGGGSRKEACPSTGQRQENAEKQWRELHRPAAIRRSRKEETQKRNTSNKGFDSSVGPLAKMLRKSDCFRVRFAPNFYTG